MVAAASTLLPRRRPPLHHVLIMIVTACLVVVGPSCCGAKVLTAQWDVEYIFWSPDGEEHMVMGINGEFPGPGLRARVGDTLQVNVTNKLHTEGVVIHWHGIRMKGTPWADGTASISQCAIAPGETFLYSFTVDKAGTYFYHGHYGMQRSAGLYGSLIVDVAEGEKEPFEYDGEFNLLLSDWWHKSVHEQEVGLSSNPFRWINEPQTLLINGTGQFNCSLAPQNDKQTLPQCLIEEGEEDKWKINVLEVKHGKTYRLRIASTTALASLNLAMEGHTMTVVEADGNYVDEKAEEVNNLDIYSGESYSVLFTANSAEREFYWISVRVRGREPQTPPALALIKYIPSSPGHYPESENLPEFQLPEKPLWNDFAASRASAEKIKGRQHWTPRPPLKPTGENPNRRIILEGTQIEINGYKQWAINNVVLSLPPTPYLGAIKHDLERVAFNGDPPPRSPAEARFPPRPDTWIFELKIHEIVDVVLQNPTVEGRVSEIHPWHLHGHDFWVLGYGDGDYLENEKENAKKLNLVDPPLKNTAVVFPRGWTALRFVADNPGVWAFHCHIEPHLHMGMGVVFAEGVDEIKKDTMKIPRQALSCGLTGQMMVPQTKVTPAPPAGALAPASWAPVGAPAPR